ncbi:PREDICTED: uncharacterized protein LOC104807823 [Tarenaya hassleriana]|uniref:uncharacterized protein LOC104807823 n=1 Tax=Tarenaya hassleriana TaxID=28532 RepID=UPI00053C44B4|nr:PREDICTED: uncharacterized protein LOC104807823 [Tarenaya hassleriana]
MENKSRVAFSLVLIAALCVAGLIRPSLAEVQQPQQLPNLPDILPIDITKCWSSLINIPGCLIEITTSILTGQFGHVGPMCCKEFSAIEDNCLPKMFPMIPFFPDLLKNSCSGNGSVCLFHKPLKVLFTGDHLAMTENGMSIFEQYNHGSFPLQLENVRSLIDLDFQWILPGHGRRVHFKDREEKSKNLEALLRFFLELGMDMSACTVSVYLPSLAEVQQPQQLPNLPNILPIDITKCWSSLVNIPGCLIEITTSVLTGQFGHVGPMCCREFSAIEDNCLPKMFPMIPFFPDLLKNSCSGNVPAPLTKK